MPALAQLRNTLSWRAIRGCPGRSVLVGESAALDRALRHFGRRFELPSTRDPVWLLLMDDAPEALLSYEKPNGSFVHTLNTAAGLERKCAQLGLDLQQLRTPGVPEDLGPASA